MLGVRRALAAVLTLFAVLSFFVALLGGRVSATLLNADFLLDHADAAGIYDAFRDEGIPALVDDFLEEQDEELPENLAALDLPADPESRARIAEVLQTLFPADWTQDTTEEVVAAILPYVLGETDEFEIDVSLHDPLVATFGAAPGERSVFEAMWLDLGMSERLIRGFTEHALDETPSPAGAEAAEGGASGDDSTGGPTPIDEQGLRDILAGDVEGAAQWWDTEFLDLISGMLPYLVGDSEEFDLSIDFTAYPALAYAFAGPLQTDAETLQAEGWQLTDRDLAEKLADADDVTIEDIDERLAIFREGGATFDEQDLRSRLDEQREQVRLEGREAEGPQDIDEVREVVRDVRVAATWGAGLLTVALVVAIAFLGGRTWPSRLRWGSAALLAASLISLIIVTPVYAAAGSSRVDTWLNDQRVDSDSPLPTPIRERLVDAGRDAIGDFFGGMQWRALAWFLLAAIGIAASIALDHGALMDRIRGGNGRHGVEPPAPDEPPPPPPAGTPAADPPTDSILAR